MIPKIIHYCWFGGKPLPEDAKECIESWKTFNPDYEIKEWNETNYDVSVNEYMLEAYRSNKWGFVSDYARLDIIYRYGGIYLDTDVEIIKSFDSLLCQKAFCGIEADSLLVNFGQGFGAEKGNIMIGKIRDSYNDLHFINKGKLDLTPCPVLNTPVIEGYLYTDKIQYLDDITVFPQDYFCPYSFYSGKTKKTNNTLSIHHFNASWFSEEQKYSVGIRNKISFLPGKSPWYIASTISCLRFHGLKYTLNKITKKIRNRKYKSDE